MEKLRYQHRDDCGYLNEVLPLVLGHCTTQSLHGLVLRQQTGCSGATCHQPGGREPSDRGSEAPCELSFPLFMTGKTATCCTRKAFAP